MHADTPFLSRPDARGLLSDEWDENVADLQYRDVGEYAVGHNVYIPLTTARCEGAAAIVVERKPMELEAALSCHRLVIVGDPGSGKTTFLRRVAFALCEGATRAAPDDAATGFLPRLTALFRGLAVRAEPGPAFPLLIRIADLAEHIRICREAPCQGAPTTEESPAWLVHFLRTKSEEFKWNLDAAFFERKLSDCSAILLLDGLDEASGMVERDSIARLFEHATQAYNECRFVVTTRPLAYVGRSLLEGFETAQIEPLTSNAIRKFLEHWCRGLFSESAHAAERHIAELAEALRSSTEIRHMARNPVMLTALAVVHWNERRLPEQRADLYESVLNWLARSRAKRKGREPTERCLALLQQLALAMQSDPLGRVLQVSKGRAADILAPQFDTVPEPRRRQIAQEFVEQEEVDSGIIVTVRVSQTVDPEFSENWGR